MIADLVIFDLDDTLYPEVEFVKSGFFEVSKYLSMKYSLDLDSINSILVSDFNNGIRKNNFDILLKKLNINEDVLSLVKIYRTHYPKISPYDDSIVVLDWLKNHGVRMALLTDGYPQTQRNKIDALNIAHFFDVIHINDISHGESKLQEKGFLEVLAQLNVRPSRSVFVGDNPKKDFAIPNKIGMLSFRIIRNESIYKFEAIDDFNKPMFTIYDLNSLIEILSGGDNGL